MDADELGRVRWRKSRAGNGEFVVFVGSRECRITGAGRETWRRKLREQK